MAFSLSGRVVSVWGNKRIVAAVLTADAASGAVDVGLAVIEGVSVAPKSAATAGPKFKANLNSALTALNGSLFISSATNGDDFYITCIGR